MGAIDRLSKAWQGLQKKSAPDYGQPSGSSLFPTFRFMGWGWNKGFQTQDFSDQVNSLDKSSLVMAVVNDTGTALAEAVPSVKVPEANGKFKPDPAHEAALLVQRPNPFNVWADYCGALSLSWWIDGNCYLKKVRGVGNDIVELWYLPHFLVQERWPGDGRSPEVPTSGKNKAENEYLSHYQYSVPGREPQLIPQRDILHIKRFVNPTNPRRGLGAFDALITEIFGAGKAAEFSATILKNMGIIVPLFMPKDDTYSPTEAEAKAFKEKWARETTGANAGNAMVMSLPLKPEKFAFSPQEMDIASLNKIPESRVAAVTRYPAAYLQFLVGLENGTSYASYEQAREQAYEQVVIPIQRVFAENLTWQLLAEFGTKGAKFFFDNSEVRVLQEDRDKLYAREISLLARGGQTINQCLEALGRDKAGPEGDIYLIPSTSAPTNAEQLIAKSDGSLAPEPIDPNVQDLAKFAEIERWFESLERQMKGFVAK